jgi:hypothetical protein
MTAIAGVMLSRYAVPTTSLQMNPGDVMGGMFALVALFIVAVIIIIVIAIAWGVSNRGRVQRPLSEATSFPPPPPPDTIMVKCEYCGVEQTWKEKCGQCGAPLPKPKIG